MAEISLLIRIDKHVMTVVDTDDVIQSVVSELTPIEQCNFLGELLREIRIPDDLTDGQRNIVITGLTKYLDKIKSLCK